MMLILTDKIASFRFSRKILLTKKLTIKLTELPIAILKQMIRPVINYVLKGKLTHFRPMFHLCKNQVFGFY